VAATPYAFVAAELWDDQAWFEIGRGQLEFACSTGTLSRLAEALSAVAIRSIRVGELAQSEALILEEKNVKLDTAEPLTTYGEVLLAAWRENCSRTTESLEILVSAHRAGERASH
jgi:hypothetical protein